VHLGDPPKQAALLFIGRVADLRQEQDDQIIPGTGGFKQPVELCTGDLVVGVRIQHLAQHADGRDLVAEGVLIKLREPELQR